MVVCVLKGAADNAVKDMESKDAIQAEFVRLSHEIEKGNAFEGHKGENDDVFRYQETMAEQVAVAACCSVVLCVAVWCSVVQFGAVRCSELSHEVLRYQETMAEQVAVAAWCSVVLCIAVRCSALQRGLVWCSVKQSVCSVLQCVAVRCSVV